VIASSPLTPTTRAVSGSAMADSELQMTGTAIVDPHRAEHPRSLPERVEHGEAAVYSPCSSPCADWQAPRGRRRTQTRDRSSTRAVENEREAPK
jgi:hypothetical protein